jgi:hypothetical protein
MSRLDDELKLIYGHKEPSPDFTSRVMQQVAARQTAAPPAPEKSLWQSLLELARPPKFRLAAAGFAACLLVAFLALQYARREEPAARERMVIAQTQAPSPDLGAGANSRADASPGNRPEVVAPPKRGPARERMARAAQNNRHAKKRVREEPIDEKALAEGEAAKEKVMLALQIASSTLNEAQRIVQGEGRRGDR